MNSRISSGQVPAMQTDPIMWSDGSTVWLFGGGVIQSMHYIYVYIAHSPLSPLFLPWQQVANIHMQEMQICGSSIFLVLCGKKCKLLVVSHVPGMIYT